MNKTVKHLLTAALPAFLFVAGLPAMVSNAEVIDGFEVSRIYVTDMSHNEVTIEKYRGRDNENVVIPSNLGSYTIAQIDPMAFKGHKEIKSVSIPETVTYIGNNVLTDVNLLRISAFLQVCAIQVTVLLTIRLFLRTITETTLFMGISFTDIKEVIPRS